MHLVSSFGYLDSSGELKYNSGFAKQLNYLRNVHTLELYGWLYAVLFNSDKILTMLTWTLKLHMRQIHFIFKRLQSAYQNFRRHYFPLKWNWNPSSSHANVLAMKYKAHNPIIHTQIKMFTASTGAQQVYR